MCAPCRRLFHIGRRTTVWLVVYRSRLLFWHPFQRRSRNPKCALGHGVFLRRAASGLRCLPLLHRETKFSRVNPELFLQLDRVIHEKGRLAIMAALAASPELSFTELRDTLGMTDGNLTSHIRTLQEEGFVSVAKSFQNNRPLTSCSLTKTGRKAFGEYIALLEQIVRQNKP
ncbi:MAG: transcriptional regulator [Verrucomicrobia bacterium]|nr:MAG: transcriptional regulator [Verrucomicrobiota bacterium]